MADQTKEADNQLPDDDTEKRAEVTSAIEEKSFRVKVFDITIFFIFCFAAIMQALLSSYQVNDNQATLSVKQQFEFFNNNLNDEISDNADQFWMWVYTLRTSIITEKQQSNGTKNNFLKLKNSPNYVASDIRITTRRIKEQSNSVFSNFSQWISTDLDPFKDPFDAAIEDNSPFKMNGSQDVIPHLIEESYRGLGGFVINLDMKNDAQFRSQINQVALPANKFVTSATQSLVADVLFYNKETHVFIWCALKAQRSAAGLVKYKLEFNKPIGQIEFSSYHDWVVIFEYTLLILCAIFVLSEIYQYMAACITFLKEKKKKGMPNFENYVQNIFNPSSDADVEKAEKTKDDSKVLLKFYFDEITGKKLIHEGPSLGNACKAIFRRDQRLIMYIIVLLLIPVLFTRRIWNSKYVELQLDTIKFSEIVDPNSAWRRNFPSWSLITGLYELTNTENILTNLTMIFMFFSFYRLLKQFAAFKNSKGYAVFYRVEMLLDVLESIVKFLTTYLITLSFIFLAWAANQHILFGYEIDEYSTLLKSFISTIMLAMREFKYLDYMYQVRPNSTLFFFILFVVIVTYFMTNIFTSLVIISYNNIIKRLDHRNSESKDEVLKQEHWSLTIRNTKCCNLGGKKGCLYRCCMRKKKQLTNEEVIELETKRSNQIKRIKETSKDFSDGRELFEKDSTKKNIKGDKKTSEKETEDATKTQGKLIGERIEETVESFEYSLEAERSYEIPNASQAFSDDSVDSSDISDDNQDADKTELVKVRTQQSQQDNSGEQNFQRTPEEVKILHQMNWTKEFEWHNLDADFDLDMKHTSNKQDAILVKQREQRCGKVIWTTFMQVIYTALYLYLIIDRFNVEAFYGQNNDLKEILWKSQFEFNDTALGPQKGAYIQDFSNINAFYQWVDTIEKNVMISRKTDYNTDGTLAALGAKNPSATVQMYFLHEEKNYFIFQGSTYCANFFKETFSQDGNESEHIQFMDDITSWDQTIRFDPEVNDGVGGYCFAFSQNYYDAKIGQFFRPLEQFKKILEQINQNQTRVYVQLLDINMIIAEPNQNVVTILDLYISQQFDGLTKIWINTQSNTLTIQITRVILQIVYAVLFLLNIYIFLSAEHNILQRFNKWNEINIEPLSHIEKTQRDKQAPKFFRIAAIILRPASLAIMAHIILTIYSEALYTTAFVGMTELANSITPYPGEPVLSNILAGKSQNLESNEQRIKFQLEKTMALQALFNEFITYRRTVIFNLFLVTTLPLQSASQSKRFRSFIEALGATIYSSLMLYFMLFLISLSVVFMGQNSFGYASDDFKTISFTCMTVFKMMIGRQIGEHYGQISEINALQAIVFTLPIVLMKAIFLTVFLAVVAYEYEQKILNQDFSSNINMLRSVFFCNISLDKRQKNKRAQMLQEQQALEKMGGAGEGKPEVKKEEEKGVDAGVANGFKLNAIVSQDGAKPVNGGLEIFNKMDIKFQIQRKIQEWAMGVADEIKQEVSNRGLLRMEAILLAQKLFQKSEGALEVNSKASKKVKEMQRLNSFNLMVARKEYIQYVWFGIQFFYFQGELIKKVIESTETEIKNLLQTQISKRQLVQYKSEYRLAMKALKRAYDGNIGDVVKLQSGTDELKKYLKKIKKDEIKTLASKEQTQEIVMDYFKKKENLEKIQKNALKTLASKEQTQEIVMDYLVKLTQNVESNLQEVRRKWAIVSSYNANQKK